MKLPNFKGWYVGTTTNHLGKDYTTFTMHDWREDEGVNFHFRSSLPEGGGEYSKLKPLLEKKQKEQQAFLAEKKEALRKEALSKTLSLVKSSERVCVSEFKKYLPGLTGRLALRKEQKLVVPMLNEHLQVVGAQTIDPKTRKKRFIKGQQVSGAFYLLGAKTFSGICRDKAVYICEGFRTGVVAHLALEAPVFVCFSAGNIKNICEVVRKKLPPHTSLVILCDDDHAGVRNTGLQKAKEAAKEYKATYYYPHFEKLSKKKTDFFDMHIEQGFMKVRAYLKAYKPVPPLNKLQTEDLGFVELTDKNKYVFCEQDFVEFIKRQTGFMMLENSKRTVYYWCGSHWVSKSIKSFLAHFHKACSIRNVKTSDVAEKALLAAPRLNSNFFTKTCYNLINFENGTYNIKTKKLEPHNKENAFTYTLPYSWEEGEDCSEFLAVLERTLTGKTNEKNLLCEFIGYAVSGDAYWKAGMLMLIGSGNNGKSTVIRIIQKLFDAKACSTLSLDDLQKPYTKDFLKDALINLSEESEPKSLLKSSEIKNLTDGGETIARPIYETPYRFTNRAKFIFALNELPYVKDQTQGLFRRMFFINFENDLSETLKEVDLNLMDKIEKERPQIINYCLKKYFEAKLKKEFTKTKDTDQIKLEIRALNDSVFSFIESMNVRIEGSYEAEVFTTKNDLYEAYCAFCEDNKFYRQGKKKFGKDLIKNLERKQPQNKHLLESKSKRTMQGVQKVWDNLKFDREITVN